MMTLGVLVHELYMNISFSFSINTGFYLNYLSLDKNLKGLLDAGQF